MSLVGGLQIALNIKLLAFLLEISMESDSIASELILRSFLIYGKVTHEQIYITLILLKVNIRIVIIIYKTFLSGKRIKEHRFKVSAWNHLVKLCLND